MIRFAFLVKLDIIRWDIIGSKENSITKKPACVHLMFQYRHGASGRKSGTFLESAIAWRYLKRH